jgi:hypothetical protein
MVVEDGADSAELMAALVEAEGFTPDHRSLDPEGR